MPPLLPADDGLRPAAHPAVSESERRADGISAALHPVRFVVTDDLKRSRLTVAFRLILAIPHFLWLGLWQYAFLACVIWAWLVALIFGRLEDDLHSFMTRYLRYQTHVYAYLFLLADPYPKFRGFSGYAIDVEIDPPERQSRWVTFFRLILAIPAFIFTMVLTTVLEVIAFAGWFVCIAIGRMPRGMRDLGAYCLRFSTQTNAYFFLLTPRYPSLASGAAARRDPEPDPEAAPEPAPEPELTPPHTP